MKAALQIGFVFAPLAIAGSVYWYLRKRRRLVTLQWPVVPAKIVHSAAGKQQSRNSAEAIVGVVVLNFEYVVNGQNYEGNCEEEFPSPEGAKRQLDNYLALPFYIRYDPANPSDYSVDPYRDAWGPSS